MKPEEKDAAYLWDMLEAAKTINQFIANINFKEYQDDKKLQLAIERSLEIIGEAARFISDTLKNKHTDIPWRKIIAQRHVIAHEYGEIKHDRIWLVVTQYIPELIQKLEAILPPLPSKKSE